MKILVIGDTLSFLAGALGRRLAAQQVRVFSLPEKKFRVRYLDLYLSFDVVISPWRRCLLDIALARPHLPAGPYLILATGSTEPKERYLGALCDAFCSQGYLLALVSNLAPVDDYAITTGDGADPTDLLLAGRRPLRVSFGGRIDEVFADYLAYAKGGHHGGLEWFMGVSTAEGTRRAKEWFMEDIRKDLLDQNEMIVAPRYPALPAAEKSLELKRCFVLMPFTPQLTEVYREILKPTIKSVGISITRADDFFTVGAVMDDIWRRINESDFLIADLTGANPNVYYELGIAHVVGKPVILISQSIEQVPFDIRTQRVIGYSTEFHAVEKFKQALLSSVSCLRDGHLQEAGISPVGATPTPT